MEDRDLMEDYNDSSRLKITDEMKSYLKEMAKWGYFLSIVGFIVVGFLLLASMTIQSVFDSLGDTPGMAGLDVGGGTLSFIYVIMASLYFFPTLHLYRFSTRVKRAILNDDQEDLRYSLEHLKKVFKFVGIFTAVIFGFYLLMLLMTLFFGTLGVLMQ
jgi:hypothetical protein